MIDCVISNRGVWLRLLLGAAIAAGCLAAMGVWLPVPVNADAASLVYGETVAGAIAAPGEVDGYTLDASAGDRVLIRIARDGGSLWTRLRLYEPDGALLQDERDVGHAEIVRRLPVSGSYTLLVSDGFDGSGTGSYKLFAQRLNAPGSAVSLSFGQTTAGSIPQAAEMDTYTVEAERGDVILVAMSRVSGGLWPEIRAYSPRGHALGATCASNDTELTFVASPGWQIHLPIAVKGAPGAAAPVPGGGPARWRAAEAGTYTLLVGDGWNASASGDYGLHVQRLNAPGSPAPIAFGQTVTATLDLPAEMDAYTFAGQAGDVVLVGMAHLTGDFWSQARVYGPDGALLGGVSNYGYVEVSVTLPADGTYLVLANDGWDGTGTGVYGLHVQRLNAPGSPAPIAFGQTVTATLDLPAEMDAYTFAGQAGGVVLVGMAHVTGDFWSQVRVYGPDSALLGGVSNYGYVELSVTLPADGTYLILANDGWDGTGTGEYSLSLWHLNSRQRTGARAEPHRD